MTAGMVSIPQQHPMAAAAVVALEALDQMDKPLLAVTAATVFLTQ